MSMNQNSRFLYTLILIFFLSTTIFGQTTTGLVGCWNFNEGSGSIAFDSSGNGYNGTITGAAWITNDPIKGKVLDFEGVDYVTIPSAVFASISTKITICAWQYGDPAFQPQQNCLFQGSNSSNYRVLSTNVPWSTSSVYFDAGHTGTGDSTNTNYDRIYQAATSSQFEGKWNHWAFTKDSSLGQMKIYLNGELWLSGSGKTKTMSGVTNFKIGAGADGQTNNYDGMICQFRIYNRVLSDAEIQQLLVQPVSKDPVPADRAFDIDPYPTLSWTPGPKAASHDLYLGTDRNLVDARNRSVHVGIVNTNSYKPEILRLATTYYWAVDDVNNNEPGSPWKGPSWKFVVRNSKEGYYKDIFIDGGAGLTSYKASDIPAVGLLKYSNEHINGGVVITNKIMCEANDGNWQDDNGSLLYPDNEPRFRLIYVNGGSSGEHKANLEPLGTIRMQNFVFHGGCYTGSCAGAWLTGNKSFRWMLAPLTLSTTNTGTTLHNAVFPDGVTAFRGRVLPRSPLIDYYPEVFGDFKILALRQNGGCRMDVGDPGWSEEKTEALLLYDFTWTQKYSPPGPVRDLTTDPNANPDQRNTHHQCVVWAHKQSPEHGKLVPCGSHPEHMQDTGEETPLQSAIYQYASSGSGRATVKAALTSGVTRIMDNNANLGYEKIGDMQYHHFTIEVPKDALALEINLDGQSYDMNLYAKNCDFAFLGEKNVIAAANTTSSDETLVIPAPSPGTWYIGVKCNDKVTASYGASNYNYTGKLDLLNGIPYSITAKVRQLAEGDIDLDEKVNNSDLKILAENWLTDNGHLRPIGENIGLWNFTEGTGLLAYDYSGFENTLNLSIGKPAWLNETMSFDGIDDYLQTDSNADKLQFSGPYTIAIRLKAAATQKDYAGILAKCSSTGIIPQNHWSLSFSNGTNAGKIFMRNNMTDWNTGLQLSQISGAWHDIAIVFDGSRITSYLDGTKIKSENFTTLPLNGDGTLIIGCERQKRYYYSGQIDDVAIYNYELNPLEITHLFEPLSTIEGLVGNWTFKNSQAIDTSGFDNNGTLMNNAAIINDERRGSVLSLTGNAYVTLPAEAFVDVNDQVTIAFWQNGNNSEPQNNTIVYAQNAFGKVLTIKLPATDSSVYFDAGNDNQGLYDTITKPASSWEYSGTWNHWVFTKDTSSGLMSIYLNGKLWHSQQGKYLTINQISSFSISHPSSGYNGLVDDFSVYNYSLSSTEVQTLYQQGLINRLICPQKPVGDLNNDCKIDALDFIILSRNWLN